MTPSQAPKLNKGVLPGRLIARSLVQSGSAGPFPLRDGPALPFPGSCRMTSPRSASAIAGPRCSPSTATRPNPGGCSATTAWPCRSRTPAGERMVKLRRGVEPLTVGDWLALDGESVLGLLDRASLLRRRAAGGDDPQLLAANLDLVLLVCGLDRPVTAGRIQRGEALAWDAGAHPVLVLTKADLADDLDAAVAAVDAQHPGLERLVTSSPTGLGIDELRAAAGRPHLGDARRVGRRQVEPRERGARHATRRWSARCARATPRAATPPPTASSTCCPAAAW